MSPSRHPHTGASWKFFPRRLHSSSGAALVMTVILLAMITILVLGMAITVRHETAISHAFEERARARLFANMGVDIVQGVLQQETADLVDPSRTYDPTTNPLKFWVSKPGALIVQKDKSTGVTYDPLTQAPYNQLARQVDLHSGIPKLDAKAPSYFQPPDLNLQTLADSSSAAHLITGRASSSSSADVVRLQVRWVYVRKDGSFDYSETPDLTQDTNPLVGRFAYWTDDESTKINLNTAWKRSPLGGGGSRPNPFSPSHPTTVDLTGLSSLPNLKFTSQMADMMHQFITPISATSPGQDYTDLASLTSGGRFFNSVRELRSVQGADFASVLDAAQFQVTHYNHTPNTTWFGEPRIVLSTDPAYAPRDADGNILRDSLGRAYFLDIRKAGATAADLWNPNASVDSFKLANTINLMTSYLSRSGWPYLPPSAAQSNFATKYDLGSCLPLTQLSLNIIDYVRCKESPGQPGTGLMIPIRGKQPAGQPFQLQQPTTWPGYTGLARCPKVTEVGLWLDSKPGIPNWYRVVCKMEIYLPKNFGLDSVDLTKLTLHAIVTPGSNGYTILPDSTILASEVTAYNPGSLPAPGNAILQAGGYAVVSRSGQVGMATARPTGCGITYWLQIGSERLEMAPQSSPLWGELDPIGVPAEKISSMEVDDPRVNSHFGNWQKNHQANTFGKINSVSSLGKPASTSISPQQDTDAAGNISDASLYMPPPFSTAPGSKNPTGRVESLAELGYIHTGMQSSNGPGVPWRTLRFQPNNPGSTTNVPPDWGLLDLFAVPVPIPNLAQGVFTPHNNTTAGRINVNAQIEPYGSSNSSKRPASLTSPLEREAPLVAALVGAPKNAAGVPLTLDEAKRIAHSISTRTLASGTSFAGKAYGYADAYDSVGEIAEIQGVADGGEESEAILRNMADLTTTRSGVFTVYSIGQSLQQTRSHSLIITGEQRQETMLERYQLPNSSTTSAPQIRFRKVSYRDLTP